MAFNTLYIIIVVTLVKASSVTSSPSLNNSSTHSTSSYYSSSYETSTTILTSQPTYVTTSIINGINLTTKTHSGHQTTKTLNITPTSSINPTSVTSSSSLVVSSSVSPVKPRDKDDGDDEPRTSLYIWEIVACAAGAVIFLQLVIIIILCHKNRHLRDKLRIRGSYSLPIRENGTWIENQDIQLWQKRASTYVQENPVAKDDEETKET